MGKIIKKCLKRITFSFITLYTIGIMLNFLNIFIPINTYTLLISCLLGFPGVISLVMVFVFLL